MYLCSITSAPPHHMASSRAVSASHCRVSGISGRIIKKLPWFSIAKYAGVPNTLGAGVLASDAPPTTIYSCESFSDCVEVSRCSVCDFCVTD